MLSMTPLGQMSLRPRGEAGRVAADDFGSLFADGDVHLAAGRDRGSGGRVLVEHDSGLRRLDALDRAYCEVGGDDVCLGCGLRFADDGGHDGLARRGGAAGVGVDRVDVGRPPGAAEDRGAELGGAAVGGESCLRAQDLVAAIFIGQAELRGELAGCRVPDLDRSGLTEVRPAPATTTPPFGLTAGLSMIELSENVQRAWQAEVTESR